jgi:hypothetical protein
MSRSELIARLLELLRPVAPPLMAIGGSLLLGYFLKRALKKTLDTKYGPSASTSAPTTATVQCEQGGGRCAWRS